MTLDQCPDEAPANITREIYRQGSSTLTHVWWLDLSSNVLPSLTLIISIIQERLFTKEEFITGLYALCTHIRSTRLRTAHNPIRLIVTGGAVSVLYLHNRRTTRDIDYVVQPLDYELVDSLAQLGWDVARQLDWPLSWLSGDVAGFLEHEEYVSVPGDSVVQNVVLFDGDVLKVYAAKFEWSLTQKLIRISGGGGTRPRLNDSDWSDAVALVHVLVTEQGRPLGKGEILGWYPINAGDIGEGVVEELAALYAERYPGSLPVINGL